MQIVIFRLNAEAKMSVVDFLKSIRNKWSNYWREYDTQTHKRARARIHKLIRSQVDFSLYRFELRFPKYIDLK